MSFTEVLRIAARFLGGLLALDTVVLFSFAHLFPTREWQATKNTLLLDVFLGVAAGGAFILLFAPNRLRDEARAWLVTAAVGTIIGLLVGGMLTWAHWDAYRIQSSISIERPADPQD